MLGLQNVNLSGDFIYTFILNLKHADLKNSSEITFLVICSVLYPLPVKYISDTMDPENRAYL